MTTASQGVAVIATVAQTDRRALSEAWYSALHLAQSDAPQRAVAGRSATVTTSESRRASQSASSLPQRRIDGTPASARTPRGANARVEQMIERRRAASETARRIARAVVTLSARRPVPAAHTVDVAGGRVRLLVHNDGSTTRIVALCSHPLREHVERALASARYSLAGAGMAVAAP